MQYMLNLKQIKKKIIKQILKESCNNFVDNDSVNNVLYWNLVLSQDDIDIKDDWYF